MALYISPARRRRRTLVVGGLALVAGLAVGVVVGRALASSGGDEVADRQAEVELLVARLDGVDLEYQQTAGEGASGTDSFTGSIDAVRAIVADTPALLERMPWVAPAERDDVIARVAAVAPRGVPPEQVSAAVAEAETACAPPPACPSEGPESVPVRRAPRDASRRDRGRSLADLGCGSRRAPRMPRPSRPRLG